MQDRYTADVGDFGKYGLLRFLVSKMEFRLGVNWCLSEPTSKELERNSNDGKFVGYLLQDTEYIEKPTEYSRRRARRLEECDPELFIALRTIIVDWLRSGKRDEFRTLKRVENSCILPRGSVTYYGESLTGNDREYWLDRALKVLSASQIVFFDPDNGLLMDEVAASVRSPKHVYFDEIERHFKNRQSLIIYHHNTRRKGGFDKEISELVAGIAKRLAIGGNQIISLRYRRGSARAYLIVTQERHNEAIEQAVCDFLSKWKDHFARVLPE